MASPTNPFLAASLGDDPPRRVYPTILTRYNAFIREADDGVSCPTCFAATANPAMRTEFQGTAMAITGQMEIATCGACGLDAPVMPILVEPFANLSAILKPSWLEASNLSIPDDGGVTNEAPSGWPALCKGDCLAITDYLKIGELYFFKDYPDGYSKYDTDCLYHRSGGLGLNRRKRELWGQVVEGRRSRPK